MLNVIDEFTHECLAIRVARKLKAIDVIDVLSDLFILRGVPGHIRSDNGPEFIAKAVQEWISAVAPTSLPASRCRTASARASCMDGPCVARSIVRVGQRSGRVRSCMRPVRAALSYDRWP